MHRGPPGRVARDVQAGRGDPRGEHRLRALPLPVGARHEQRGGALLHARGARPGGRRPVRQLRRSPPVRSGRGHVHRGVLQQQPRQAQMALLHRNDDGGVVVEALERGGDGAHQRDARHREDPLEDLVEAPREAQVVDQGLARQGAGRAPRPALLRPPLVRPDPIAEELRVGVPGQGVRAPVEQGCDDLGVPGARRADSGRLPFRVGGVYGEVQVARKQVPDLPHIAAADRLVKLSGRLGRVARGSGALFLGRLGQRRQAPRAAGARRSAGGAGRRSTLQLPVELHELAKVPEALRHLRQADVLRGFPLRPSLAPLLASRIP
mmetsp:Transcript_1551/g.4696  ORF Transcript_1551/g.4696 Transcript_1551/m.4696 type:complete len:322 (+) Transcript_1551:339-1304(+)